MTLAELFSGIGGWSEAARMAGGITPIWHSENDPNKIKFYEHRHPNIPNLGDIRNIISAPYADIFTISFPCTGFSTAGKGEGFENEGSGMWYEAERIIGLVRPKYVVIENSPTLNLRGLHRILCALAQFGYNAEWTNLCGHHFGIQQHRKRLYLIANTDKIGRKCGEQPLPLFRKLRQRGVGEDITGIYPGWRERRDIPEPRTYGSAYDIPGGVHRLAGTGDAILPIIGCYVLCCIKLHHNATR